MRGQKAAAAAAGGRGDGGSACGGRGTRAAGSDSQARQAAAAVVVAAVVMDAVGMFRWVPGPSIYIQLALHYLQRGGCGHVFRSCTYQPAGTCGVCLVQFALHIARFGHYPVPTTATCTLSILL